jgi:hypothetical protein
MWRRLMIGILVLGGVLQAGAQEVAAPRLAVRVGAGLSGADAAPMMMDVPPVPGPETPRCE